MKINKLLTIVFLAMALALNFTNVFADDELDEAADQYNKNKSNDRYKVVCTREAPVGTRIKKKVCRTVAMIEQGQHAAKEALSKLRTNVGNQ
jgi:hypothetical protein